MDTDDGVCWDKQAKKANPPWSMFQDIPVVNGDEKQQVESMLKKNREPLIEKPGTEINLLVSQEYSPQIVPNAIDPESTMVYDDLDAKSNGYRQSILQKRQMHAEASVQTSLQAPVNAGNCNFHNPSVAKNPVVKKAQEQEKKHTAKYSERDTAPLKVLSGEAKPMAQVGKAKH